MCRIVLSLLIFLIKLYQWVLSPYLGHYCRFLPTCSRYAIEAIRTHGYKGVILSIIRILRCNPYCSKCGFDPVPPVVKTKCDT